MAFNPTEFLNDLLKDTKLSDDQKAALQSAVADPTIGKRLEEGQLRQADYSRNMQAYQQELARVNSHRQSLVDWQQTEIARLQALESQLRPSNGQGQGEGAPSGTGEWVSKRDFEQELVKVQTGAIGFISTINDKSLEFYQEFGKRLDTQAVLKKAQEDNTNFQIAYERYIQPMKEEKMKADVEKRIETARAEERASVLANLSIPSTTTSGFQGGPAHVLDLAAKAPEGGYGWQAAVAAHSKAIATGTVGKG